MSIARFDGATVRACCDVEIAVMGGDQVGLRHDDTCPQGPAECAASVRAVARFLRSHGVAAHAWAAFGQTGLAITSTPKPTQ